LGRHFHFFLIFVAFDGTAGIALLAYASSWLKRHEPAAFLAALLNSQPMGFYSPSSLVQDTHRHNVDVRAVDVCISN